MIIEAKKLPAGVRGTFLGAVLVERLWQKVTRVVASMIFAVLTNLARGLFPTGRA